MSALDKMGDAQKAELDRAIEAIKTSEYKGTHIKVELEAQLNRPYGDERSCDSCAGDGYHECSHCEGEGVTECANCEGAGETPVRRMTCARCDGDGERDCGRCGGSGRRECSDCRGSGEAAEHHDWSESGCQTWLLNNVPEEAKNALTYRQFYDDGSVDSEFTFTLPLEKTHLVVHFIEAFEAMAKAMHPDLKEIDVQGAGMHIAILNSKSGNYPGGNSIDYAKADNFARSMQPLLPALFFLASPNHRSRTLRYRKPQVDMSDKYCAVTGHQGVFEYRVFETCYDVPLAFIDFVIVIANSLRYYTARRIDTSMGLGRLGVRDGHGLDRFYYSQKHVEALNKGLELLKPEYKSIEQLGKERGIEVGDGAFDRIEKKRVANWTEDFDEVKKRRHYERLRLYHTFVAEANKKRAQGEELNVRQYAKTKLAAYVEDKSKKLKGTLGEYISEERAKHDNQSAQYTVTA